MKNTKMFLSVILFLTLFWMSETIHAQYLKGDSKTLILEAEGFTDRGGWTIDQQYMDIMGSPVLLAHGLGKPVTDATTHVIFAKKGKYKIYVRTRNWVAPWTKKEAPGRFQISCDNHKLPTIYGTEGDPWHWQKGDEIIIDHDGQSVKISLCDLTGFDGRVDALCFTANENFIPPDDVSSLIPLRHQALNLPDTPPCASEKPFDLVVIGGGIAGTCAAVSAARLGLNVALIQDRPVLGGNGSSEIRVNQIGLINRFPYPNLGNLTEEIGQHGGGNASEPGIYQDDRRLNVVLAEKNIKLFLNTHVNKVFCSVKNGIKSIDAVLGENIATGQITRFEGMLFADCTGDGNLGFLAGADWKSGRESRKETGENHAPENADSLVMGASILWNTVTDEKTTTFPELPWAVQFNEKSIRPSFHGDYNWETGHEIDQIKDVETIRDMGLRAAFGHWSYMKNKLTGPMAKSAEKRRLGWVSFITGKRESRRLMGDVILKEQDLTGYHIYPDATLTATWGLGIHYPDKEYSRFFDSNELHFRSVGIGYYQISPYPIPYRCLYSRNINNLFMAGRNISVTHLALGSIRVMRTCGMMGEVVGMAASICRKHNVNPRDIYKHYFDQLQALMKNGVGKSNFASLILSNNLWLSNHGENFAYSAKIETSETSDIKNRKNWMNHPKFVNDGRYAFNDDWGVSWSLKEEKGQKSAWISFAWKNAKTLNSALIFTGGSGPQKPIRDFVLQYEKDGKFIDIPASKISENKEFIVPLRFPEVIANKFRLFITASPDDIARLWEVELYHCNSFQNKP